jgi:putative flippase GtrA
MPESHSGIARANFKRYHRLIYTVSRAEWLREFALHVLTGILTVIAHYSVMWLLVRSGMAAIPASGIGFLAGAATRFVLSYTKVFSPSDSVPVTLARFIVALGLQWVINITLLDFLLFAGLRLWLAQISTTAILTFINYLAYRLWVFKS